MSLRSFAQAWKRSLTIPRPPDFVIGGYDDPYMRRWWMIPRNKWFNIYLHHIRHDDDDRALHDHPWWNISVILKGAYIEHMPGAAKRRGRWWPTFRSAKAAHRLQVAPNCDSVWTLFITGPVIREWGFHCPRGWRHWREFVSERDKGSIGRGCD